VSKGAFIPFSTDKVGCLEFMCTLERVELLQMPNFVAQLREAKHDTSTSPSVLRGRRIKEASSLGLGFHSEQPCPRTQPMGGSRAAIHSSHHIH